MRQICRDEDMPSDRAVRQWMETRPDVATAIARARVEGFDAIAEECLRIADDASNDWMVMEHGDDKLDAEHVQRSKLRIETRLKLLAKWDPKRYGEKLQTEHSGSIDVVSKEQRDAATSAAARADR